MDGLFHGKPNFLMDDLGGKKPYFWFNTHWICSNGLVNFAYGSFQLFHSSSFLDGEGIFWLVTNRV